MNRTTGMLGLFAAGVAVGVVATKWLDSAPPVASPAMVTRDAGGDGVAAPSSETSVTVTPPEATVTAAPPAPPVTPATAPDASTPPGAAAAPVVAMTAPYATPIDSGSVQAIDVGERLRKHIDRPSQPGHENEIGDAHRALEREPRDDGWAYTMEAELQNSMVNEVSTGGFRVDGVECRSTICEVRISGAAAQSAAVKRWNDSLMSQPFGQRLFINYGSTFSDNERVDGIFIFRKPKKP